jgi:C-terminal processing protease CtpA/Prc
MASKKSQKRDFNGMSYGEVQRTNSENRSKLKKEDQKWLKDNGYKNVGWDNVITLYRKVEELLDKSRFEDMSLEELFLEADRIGNKYLTPEEIKEFNQQLSKEVAEIGELVDKQFPDTEIEVIDFSQKTAQKPQKKRNQKTYRTIKL